ncbi:MAG: HEPN domain-containing protein [Candidatus Margulisbacteria bacterium]|nr:HEPN domain-containing protein [Candidatus Margulisiibacteriota bacterium]
MHKKMPTVEVNKSQYVNYYKKALEFFQSMQNALDQELWSSAGLSAVHAAISANDAVLVFFHGIRSVSKDHQDAVNLTLSLVDYEGVKEALSHLRRLLAKKNLVEYEGKLFTRSDAEDVAKHAERFIGWVKGILPRE